RHQSPKTMPPRKPGPKRARNHSRQSIGRILRGPGAIGRRGLEPIPIDHAGFGRLRRRDASSGLLDDRLRKIASSALVLPDAFLARGHLAGTRLVRAGGSGRREPIGIGSKGPTPAAFPRPARPPARGSSGRRHGGAPPDWSRVPGGSPARRSPPASGPRDPSPGGW